MQLYCNNSVHIGVIVYISTPLRYVDIYNVMPVLVTWYTTSPGVDRAS